jgi:hypothetical protein
LSEQQKPQAIQLQIKSDGGAVDARVQEFKKYIELAEEKTVITLLEKLVDPNILEFITEYPSTQYTKEMTKLMTFVKSYAQVYNLDLEDEDDCIIINEMCHQFMLKMTSHKRRRSHELVNGASRQNTDFKVLDEQKGLKRLFGVR